MASTLVASSSSPAGNISLSKNLSDADAARILSYAVARYGGTNTQAFQSMMNATYTDLMRKVGDYYREQARTGVDASNPNPVLS